MIRRLRAGRIPRPIVTAQLSGTFRGRAEPSHEFEALIDTGALTQLADLAEGGDGRLEVRLFGGGSVAFYPKAYIFWSSAGEAAAGYDG